MLFKWPKARVINRFGNKFESNEKGELTLDLDSVKKIVITIEDWNEIKNREGLTDSEKDELISAIKGYGFSQVVDKKEK